MKLLKLKIQEFRSFTLNAGEVFLASVWEILTQLKTGSFCFLLIFPVYLKLENSYVDMQLIWVKHGD